MTVFEIIDSGGELTARQRWANNLLILFAIVAFIIGVNLRESSLNATWLYTNTEAGIRAEYPQNWLIDTQGNYVFRIRDVSQIGYPTTIQLSVQPVSSSAPPRYIFDALTLNRSQTLAQYNVLASGESFTLPDESSATRMDYIFAATENDPFLQNVPVIVRGQDILAIKRGQAIIITFLSESTRYEQNYAIFERFISSLEF
jgi:hypothetical protein